MPDMGYRDNVMGPQPIGKRKPIPESLMKAVTQILDLLAEGKGSELTAMSVEHRQRRDCQTGISGEPRHL